MGSLSLTPTRTPGHHGEAGPRGRHGVLGPAAALQPGHQAEGGDLSQGHRAETGGEKEDSMSKVAELGESPRAGSNS